jgi:hypothetical protein
VNYIKVEIDKLKIRLDRKEEERRNQNKQLKNELAMDDDDNDVQKEEIIDEEELIMLREMKDLKRDYRDTFSRLKASKQDFNNYQDNIDQAKQQLIHLFEVWYADNFESAVG